MTSVTDAPRRSWLAPRAAVEPDPRRRRRLAWEVWIVLGLSLGQSGVYAVVALIAAATRGPIGGQTTAINTSQSPRPWLDLTYQLLGIGFAVVPVLLALYLLGARGRPARERLGLDGTRPLRDLGWALALGAGIGVPGIAVYAIGRALGVTIQVQASALNAYWWTVPILILAALKNGLIEEIIVVGYLAERLDELGWKVWAVIATSALVRGSYHLYQGYGPFLANVAMGVVFATFYCSRWGRRRVWPLVIAHTLIDVVAFVGYALLPAAWLAALGVR